MLGDHISLQLILRYFTKQPLKGLCYEDLVVSCLLIVCLFFPAKIVQNEKLFIHNILWSLIVRISVDLKQFFSELYKHNILFEHQGDKKVNY